MFITLLRALASESFPFCHCSSQDTRLRGWEILAANENVRSRCLLVRIRGLCAISGTRSLKVGRQGGAQPGKGLYNLKCPFLTPKLCCQVLFSCPRAHEVFVLFCFFCRFCFRVCTMADSRARANTCAFVCVRERLHIYVEVDGVFERLLLSVLFCACLFACMCACMCVCVWMSLCVWMHKMSSMYLDHTVVRVDQLPCLLLPVFLLLRRSDGIYPSVALFTKDRPHKIHRTHPL